MTRKALHSTIFVCLAFLFSFSAVAAESESSPAFIRIAPGADQALTEISLDIADNADITLNAIVVDVDKNALYAIPNEVDTDRDIRDRVARTVPMSGGHFTVQLENGLNVEVIIDRAAEHIGGTTTYVGHLAGISGSFATFSINSDGILGFIDTTVDRYAIEPLATADGFHPSYYIVRRLDLQALAELSGPDFHPESSKGSLSKSLAVTKSFSKTPIAQPPYRIGSAQLKGGGSSEISVMVVYTSAADAERNMDSFISNIISTMNQALNNTGGVSHNVFLSHSEKISYTSSGNRKTDVLRMGNGSDGYMDYLDAMLSTWGSDVALLITDDDAYQYPGGVAYNYLSSDPFGVVADDWALGDYTFPHETGHIMGAKHQWEKLDIDGSGVVEQDEMNQNFASGYGYQSQVNNWRTMMAICNGANMCLTRQLFFSNPNKTYQNEARGVPAGQPTPADMSSTLNSSMLSVAGWMSNPPKPGRPSYLDVEPLLCFGSNLVSWPNASGDVGEYRLYLSQSSNFNSQVLVYVGEGNSTSVSISHGQDPSYLRIKAPAMAAAAARIGSAMNRPHTPIPASKRR